jgi:hypothetical protein
VPTPVQEVSNGKHLKAKGTEKNHEDEDCSSTEKRAKHFFSALTCLTLSLHILSHGTKLGFLQFFSLSASGYKHSNFNCTCQKRIPRCITTLAIKKAIVTVAVGNTNQLAKNSPLALVSTLYAANHGTKSWLPLKRGWRISNLWTLSLLGQMLGCQIGYS